MRVSFFGLGKLGTPVALAMERAGKHHVIGYDPDPEVAKALEKKSWPYRENYVNSYLKDSQLEVVTPVEAVEHAEILFVCVPTPHAPELDGSLPLSGKAKDFDYTYLEKAADQLSDTIRLLRPKNPPVVSVISTVLPGTMRRLVLPRLEKIPVAYNPFFAAMGTVVDDVLDPEFVLVGSDSGQAYEVLKDFYRTVQNHAPTLRMSVESAELTKVAYNLYISRKIEYANSIMEICHKIPGCDVDDVTDALKIATTRLISSRYLTGGMPDGGNCFTADSLVITDVGPRRIADIEPGDSVLTSEGTFAPVVRRWERHYQGDVVKVKVEGSLEVEATPNHPFHAAEDGRSIYPNGRRNSSSLIRDKLKPIQPIPAGELSDDHFAVHPIQTGLTDRPWYATDDYCLLAGWYLSEGHLGLRQSKVGNYTSGRISFALHQKEMNVAEILGGIMTRLSPPKKEGRGAGAVVSIKKATSGKGLSVRYGSLELAIRLMEDFGKGAAEKRLPKWATNGSPDTMRLILQGLFQGDGHSRHGGIFFTTISPNLAFGVVSMLERLGICTGLRSVSAHVGKDGQGHRTSYDVRVRNYTDAAKLALIVGMPFKYPDQPKKYERAPLIGGNRMRRVISCERRQFVGMVYNLWVDHPTHTYVTAAGTVSNCHPRDGIAMSWLADELCLNHNPFKEVSISRDRQAGWLASLAQKHASEGREEPLPIVLLGKSFKAHTGITGGSAAVLVKNILESWGTTVTAVDPYVDNFPPAVAPKFLVPSLFLVATKHDCFRDYIFPSGSIVVDPHRYMPKQDGVQLIKVGVGQ